MPDAAGVILVGGSGSRFGGEQNKAYLPLRGRSVVSWSLGVMTEMAGIDPVVLVIRPEDRAHAERILGDEVPGGGDVEIVPGGPTRPTSELAALRHLAPRIESGAIDTVLIHDGARPLVSARLCREILAAARRHGGAIPALESFDIVPVGAEGPLGRPLRFGGPRDRPGLAPYLRIQTPQGFDARVLAAAYERSAREGFEGTDTASCLERFSDLPIAWVHGEERNFKITFARDLLLAERLMADPARPASGRPASTGGSAADA